MYKIYVRIRALEYMEFGIRHTVVSPQLQEIN